MHADPKLTELTSHKRRLWSERSMRYSRRSI